MATRPNCEARQYSDQMVCVKCDLSWDVNDLDPPKCGNEKTEDDRRKFVAETKRKRFW